MATSLKIDDSTKDRIRRLADARERTPHWIMREAIREYLEREEARESFLADAMAAWKDYRETGRHVAGDDTLAWLATWGTADERPAPPYRD
ncbi:CopG family ribbon-helix-helix protein [uncultured Sphingomonas sp.]|uniref:CopG family ribbon-helix-helix protein n=1 Tax=uncultured Sphingomonas sp. TaxID=158754 RepID=UPI0025CB89DB|nr:CopG family ribbon-helix-helix protein [uncultured Sphingomonas sp.]